MNHLLAQTINLIDPSSPYNQLQSLRPSQFVTAGINLLLGGAGVAACGYLLIGGFNWVTSSGDKEGLDKAKKKITHALIGLTIVFSAYALIFVIQSLFGINNIQLNISPIGGSGAPTCVGPGAPCGPANPSINCCNGCNLGAGFPTCN